MLTEMARMSLGDRTVIQIQPDTRAFMSIPARHAVARRMDCRFFAQLVAEHKIEQDEVFELALELAYSLAKRACKL